ncbi:hypothetical protein POTOM_044182 [Populus tomentosa]|uniref:Uncharacterized protein n=1 Tax=Populus tomentosa TaxID=118781 RepID=A0A8X7YMX4_POPTO|nr:hypothetical protein POTOM_044182 [Populus tomentosa]
MTIKIKLRSLLLEMEMKRYHYVIGELRDVSANAVNALAEHCPDLIGIGFLDCLKVDEVALGPVVSVLFLLATGISKMKWRVQFKKSLSPDPEHSWYSVNLCLSPGYSTITWFAIGYFFEGGVVLHCFVFTYALFDLACFGVADSAILHRQRSNKAFQDLHSCQGQSWIGMPFAVLLLPFCEL